MLCMFYHSLKKNKCENKMEIKKKKNPNMPHRKATPFSLSLGSKTVLLDSVREITMFLFLLRK